MVPNCMTNWYQSDVKDICPFAVDEIKLYTVFKRNNTCIRICLMLYDKCLCLMLYNKRAHV